MDIPAIPLQNPSQVIDRGQKPSEAGLFSAFTSYISSYAAGDPPEPSDEELESTLCTVDCVNACYMGDVFANVVSMPVQSLVPLVSALLAELPDDPTSVVISVKSENDNQIQQTDRNQLPAGQSMTQRWFTFWSYAQCLLFEMRRQLKDLVPLLRKLCRMLCVMLRATIVF
jgi:hypothetical protein